ncbi:DUF5057 domain-containing protein [Paenibacillus sp. PL2-23]|uniref:DUF5057 domain-containing protein n=1 Tax=Paenibacillus sp. PL2-23 TaxID=2100729 RepID=UPI0030F70CF8
MKLSKFQQRVSAILVVTLSAMLFTYAGDFRSRADAATITDAVTLSTGGKFVSASGSSVSASADVYSFNELFVMEEHGSDIVAFKSKLGGTYLSYKNASSSNSYALSAVTATSAGDTEKFKKTDMQNGSFALQSSKKISSTYRFVERNQNGTLSIEKESTSQRFTPAARNLRATVNVLEITQTGASDLAGLIGGKSLLSIKTYSMKEFVASRETLNDKYDAIYIGRGIYSPELPPKLTTKNDRINAHNTKDIQNDITQLKANEITRQFIDAGLPVIFYSDAGKKQGVEHQPKYNNRDGLLKSNFAKYNTNAFKRSNVVFVNESHLASTSAFNARINLLEEGNKRPQLTVTAQPVDYTSNQSSVYVPGDTITFGYAVGNVGDLSKKSMHVNLYIGMDSSLPFGAEQLVATENVVTSTGSISYTLPPGYTGVQYWRLELADLNSPLIDAKTGVYRFKDRKININVLQVMPNNSTSSNLNTTTNLNGAYLSPTTGDKKDAYSIKVDAKTITQFNLTDYQNLNGKYDMIIFGYSDYYNNYAPINDAASAAVLDFIATGQSVMFTHDTIFLNSNVNNKNWVEKFSTVSGQIQPQTDMGFGNPVSSNKTEKVNDGLLTQYPFLLNDTTSVAATHNQYFTLDLEDPTVIPWYNMIDSTRRTPGDSWNHYYTYSKGNVTYSGSGHTNTKFPDWEQQLFVNTMYRAYMGSNHAPQLTVNSPVEYDPAKNNFIPSYSDILINYSAYDLDLNDRDLTTSVNLIYNNQSVPLITKQQVYTGETINMSVPNPLPQGGDLTIEIKAWDPQGAEVVQNVKVKVVKVESNLALQRTPSANVVDNKIKTNDTAVFTYTVTPKAIDKSLALPADRMIIKDLSFSETFPPNLEISSLPSGFTKSGTLAQGYTVTGQLANIPYQLSGNSFVASPILFNISVIPKKDDLYSLMNATLQYSDVGGQASRTLQFPSYILQAITMIDRIQLSNMTILEGDKKPVIPVFTPENPTIKQLQWESDRPDIVTVNSSGIVTGIKPGTAVIKATATDGSNKSATATVNVIRPGLNIIGGDRVAVGETLSLASSLNTADYEVIESYSWSITQGSSNASLQSTGSNATSVSGSRTGTATVSLTVTTNQTDSATGNKRTYSTSKVISVYSKLSGLTLTGTDLEIEQSKRLTPVFIPADATFKAVNWSSSNSNIVRVDSNGNVFGAGVGQAVITVATIDGSGLSANAIVNVTVPKPIIQAADRVPLGGSFNVVVDQMKEAQNDPVRGFRWIIDSNASHVEPISDPVLNQVTYKALKEGTVTVRLELTTLNGRIYSSDAESILIEPVTLWLKDTKTMDPGQTADLWEELSSNPTVGKDMIKESLSWSSTDPDIVSVDPVTGVITAHQPGSATIIVGYAFDTNITAAITVIVSRPPITPLLPDGESKY